MRVELKKIDRKFAADFPCFYFFIKYQDSKYI